ncbi:MAG: endonuclease YncB(thermonuclease family) [Rickettsiales bacterium]|jgi:endonuclease YncB( thermonuclease family)
MENKILSPNQYSQLYCDLKTLISNTKEEIEKFARHQLIVTYWQIGRRIDEERMTLNANYSALIIGNLSEDLAMDKNTLTRAVQFFKTYPNLPEKSSLSWSHYRHLITVSEDSVRSDLEDESKNENWSATKLADRLKNFKESGNQNIANLKIKRPTKANYLYRAKIINVVDGDTMVLDVDLGFDVVKRQRIRLAQIDCAEMKTDEGQKSFKYLRDLAASLNEVVVRTNKVDIFGRFIGDLFYSINDDGVKSRNEKIETFENGVYLNEKIVTDGMARIV